MNGLALLIPLALGLGLAALGAFFWTVRSGQFDDLDGAALRILIEEDAAAPPAHADRQKQPDTAPADAP